MTEEKLRCDEVPSKFTDWLLFMGCPADKIPSSDKVAQMCRGQYYMVWRSLMERVQSKDVIRQKRLQVFVYDKKKSSNEYVESVVPEELTAWKKHKSVEHQVVEAEHRVAQAQQTLKQLMEKVSSKLSQRNLVRSKAQDAQRRVWFLQNVAEELKAKEANLEETRLIAESLCRVEDGVDIQAKLDKCLSLLRPQPPPAAAAALSMSVAHPVACSSILSNTTEDDIEEHISSLMRSPAHSVWSLLLEKRAGLVRALATANQQPVDDCEKYKSITPDSVLAHTAAMHCMLSLEVVKNRLQLKQTTRRLENAISNLSEVLSGPACELAVLRLERGCAEARIDRARELLSELSAARGVFAAKDAATPPTRAVKTVAQLDKAIIFKKEEIKALLFNLAKTERKIVRARESLLAMFNNLQTPVGNDGDKYTGHSVDNDSIAAVRKFYMEWCAATGGADLSMDMDLSTEDMTEDLAEPTFMDELRIYLKKFNLEKNRKLVLESGEKIWSFETLQASADRLYDKWLTDDVSCNVICPSVGVSASIAKLLEKLREKSELEEHLKAFEEDGHRTVDIASALNKSEEEELLDGIKKRLGDQLTALQRTDRTLELGRQNLSLWDTSPWRELVSNNRTVEGKTYKEYEDIYLENLNPTA